MKAMRWLVVGLVACVANADVLAEDKPDTAKLIVGKWEATDVDEGTLPKGSFVEFTKDGKLKVTVKMGDQEMTVEGTYKLNGDKFDIVLKFGDAEDKNTITIKKISKTEFHTTDKEGKKVNLTRKN